MQTIAKNLKKIGIDYRTATEMYKILDDTYLNLARLCLYGETYEYLQRLDDYMMRLIDNEELEDDELDDIKYFYNRYYKYN